MLLTPETSSTEHQKAASITQAGSLLLPLDESLTTASSPWVNALAVTQEAFFAKMNKLELEDDAVESVHNLLGEHVPAADRNSDASLHASLTTFTTRKPSHTLVLEAAMHVIHKLFCDVRQSEVVNVNWA